jgi:hypothetical protein
MRGPLRKLALLLTALVLILAATPLTPAGAADEFEKYALESVGASLSTNQAGAHADFTTSFALTRSGSKPYALTRDVEVRLPPGLIGNPQGIPRCTVDQLGTQSEQAECPVDSQVGVTEVRVLNPISGTFTEPVYNMDPPGGDVVARLGFYAVGWPAFINVRVDPTDYSLIASIEGAPSTAGLLEATTTLWGVPAAPIHDEQRITPEEARTGETPEGGRQATVPERPFLSNPTDCVTKRQITVTARSYQLPDSPSTMSAPFPDITGCGRLNFSSRFSVLPTNTEASAPTGLEAELTIPQNETPSGRATSTLKSAAVTLPEGLTINPAAGDGLEACSSEQVGLGTAESSHCPDAAKIGTVELDVPALERTLHGSLYQRTPEPGRLFRFWLVADEQGVHLKLPAEIEADPATGQLTTVFAGIESLGGLPQVPVERLKLHVSGGPRAPLATPPRCGTYQSHFQFNPWSGGPSSEGETPMQINGGCGKGGFAPKIVAGSTNSAAGTFAPFAFTLTRQDGEANPRLISLHLPQGLLAKLGGVTLCPDALAATGNCPPASKVGSLTAAAGVGGAPLWLPQPGKPGTAVYLAGPYEGAPYSIISVVPAQAGPFDLGAVVNRAAIHVDPETALVTIVTDPLPQILEGVPVAYRTIHVAVNRENFTLNPTSCAPKLITASVTAAGGETAQATDGFQATNCARLGFAPKLRLRLKGGTSRTSHPALEAILRTRKGDANIKRAVVTLPHSAFLDQAHIRTVCTRVQFAADRCPAGSIYGSATARTPLLDRALSGPVYLRSSSNTLPDLVAALEGPIDINLVGRIDSANGGIRTTFASVPDAPVSSFALKMKGGAKGLIVNSRNLCAAPSRALVDLTAHNGRRSIKRPAIGVRCAKR